MRRMSVSDKVHRKLRRSLMRSARGSIVGTPSRNTSVIEDSHLTDGKSNSGEENFTAKDVMDKNSEDKGDES